MQNSGSYWLVCFVLKKTTQIHQPNEHITLKQRLFNLNATDVTSTLIWRCWHHVPAGIDNHQANEQEKKNAFRVEQRNSDVQQQVDDEKSRKLQATSSDEGTVKPV